MADLPISQLPPATEVTGQDQVLIIDVSDTNLETRTRSATVQQLFSSAAFTISNMTAKLASTTNINLTGLQTIDSVALLDGDRILVAGQTNQANNGVYIAGASTWTRAADTLVTGYDIQIMQGLTQAGKIYTLTTTGTIVVGTTPLQFQSFSQGGQGSGSATTIADGADVALGSTTDVAAVGTGAGTLIANVKNVNNRIQSSFDSVNNALRVNLVAGSSDGSTGGDASAANQVTGNASLASIDTKVTGIATAANQTTSNATLSSIDTKLTNNATTTLQTAGNTSLNSIDLDLGALNVARADGDVDGSINARLRSLGWLFFTNLRDATKGALKTVSLTVPAAQDDGRQVIRTEPKGNIYSAGAGTNQVVGNSDSSPINFAGVLYSVYLTPTSATVATGTLELRDATVTASGNMILNLTIPANSTQVYQIMGINAMCSAGLFINWGTITGYRLQVVYA